MGAVSPARRRSEAKQSARLGFAEMPGKVRVSSGVSAHCRAPGSAEGGGRQALESHC